jgi:hypothetical protein
MSVAVAEGDRFARWPRAGARMLLAVLALLLLLSALVPIAASDAPEAATRADAPGSTIAPSAIPAKAKPKRDEDLALYDRIAARVGRGENYYAVATDEQRRGDYPVRPGLAVRLPTLAYAEAALGPAGMQVAAWALVLAVLAAWYRRFGAEPGGAAHRLMATALLVPGCSLALSGTYLVVHEIWAGLLLLLSFGLHRPGREPGQWLASLAVAALALAIREQALPFVLLMATMAFWHGDRRQGAAWALLALLFVAALAVHLAQVAPHVLPTDRASPSWLALRGLSGWLSDVVLSGSLQFLPHWLAGPLAVLMVLGWAGWRSSAGTFGTLLFLGYAVLFMIAGRANNFYWGAVIAPGLYTGLAFLPMALTSLWRAAK